MRKKISVLVADSQNMFAEAVCFVLNREDDIKVQGIARDGASALELNRSLVPDVVVLSADLPPFLGVETVRRILKQNPTTKIILVLSRDDGGLIEDLARAPVLGYLSKDGTIQDLAKGVREVYANGAYATAGFSARFFSELKRVTRDSEKTGVPRPLLTKRELEVLRLIVEEHTNRKIAEILEISPKTVEKHRQAIMDKLDIHTVVGLVLYAIKRGVIQVPS